MIEDVHVQMEGGDTFCVEARGHRVRAIAAASWRDDPTVVQKATCSDCLLRLYMLGDSANIALRNMGMRVDVQDVDEASLAEN